MIKIITRIVPPLDANCYEVIDESTDNRLIIDVGGGFNDILKSVENKGKIVGALFTHGDEPYRRIRYSGALEI